MRIIYLAGWKLEECRYWFVKKSNGEFIVPTPALKRTKISLININYAIYFEHLHSKPLLREAEEKKVEGIKQANVMIKEFVKNF